MSKRTHQPKGDGKVPGAIPDLPSAINNPNRVGPVDERHPLVDELRNEAAAKAALAVAALKDAEDRLVKAIAAYELAAQLTMTNDFTGGYRIATGPRHCG